jgi:hypothetical protein
MIIAGLGLLFLILAIFFLARGKQAPLDGEEIRSLRRVSDQVRREAVFPFE